MGDVGETFSGWRKNVQGRHKAMLEKADTTGWTQHTPHHFSRVFDGVRVNWWPGAGKAQIGSRMVYGHKQVNVALAAMKKETP